jgi:hypothetical protein
MNANSSRGEAGTGNSTSGTTPPGLGPGLAPTPVPSFPKGTLNVAITVKEVAGVGAQGFPVSTVIPLPQGTYQDIAPFKLEDATGSAVPAQFEVLGRWYGKDNSIRHLLVHYQPTVTAFTSAGTGTASYRLKDRGGNIAPARAVQLSEAGGVISVSTGALNFSVQRSPFRILTPKGQLKAVFQGKEASDQQLSFDRSDIAVTIEERGPLRTVIRAEAPAIFNSVTDHKHGFAVRLYAYAGKPYLKVDYQLQNSAKNVKYAGPLYFESLHLELDTGASATPASVRAELVNGDFSARPEGALQANGVGAVIRYFHETWPNGLELSSSGILKIELWPSWSANFYQGQVSPTGLYWLDDMQHAYKEVLLNFGNLDATELANLSKTLHYPPVATLPVAWYADTRATLDMGGLLPVRTRVTSADLRRPTYSAAQYDASKDVSTAYRTYIFGWMNFAGDVDRKLAANMTGGWPYSASAFLATENPKDYFAAETFAMGELNMRPEWMTGYKYATDQALLKLTENPYGGGTWRAFEGHGRPTGAAYLDGTGKNASARDDQHGWMHHMQEAYYITGNPWIKDWYTFIAEFRKVRLHQADPFPDMSSRALGHSLGQAIAAFNVTGDPEIIPLFQAYLTQYLKPHLSPIGVNLTLTATDGSKQESSFQAGYLARALINYMESTATTDPNAYQMVQDFVEWNKRVANFSYYVDCMSYASGPFASSGTGTTFADAQAYLLIRNGDKAAETHLTTYINSGLGTGGEKPYGNLKSWTGDYIGRWTSYLLQHPLP